MTATEILENKTVNLIPIINPGLKGESGIRAALLYRIRPSIEIDTADVVKIAYRELYGDDIPDRGDVILNAFIPFLDFCRGKLKGMHYKIPKNQKELLELIFLHIDEIFCGYEELKILFDRYFDLMYSFSNLMPCPKYFNGSPGKNGKGTWGLNNDYPYLYYENLKDSNSGIYKREQMKSWLDGVFDKYRLRDLYKLKPPYSIKEYYGLDDTKLSLLSSYVTEAIVLIENRFTGSNI